MKRPVTFAAFFGAILIAAAVMRDGQPVGSGQGGSPKKVEGPKAEERRPLSCTPMSSIFKASCLTRRRS